MPGVATAAAVHKRQTANRTFSHSESRSHEHRNTGHGDLDCLNQDLLSLVVQERETTCVLLEEWLAHHNKVYEENMARQEQLFQSLLDSHQTTLQGLTGLTNASPISAIRKLNKLNPRMNRLAMAPPPIVGDTANAEPSPREARATVAGEPRPAKEVPDPVEQPFRETEEEKGPSRDIQVAFEEMEKNEGVLNWWRRTSGLHTVEKWVSNYRKHPAGWAALLMIHGIPEVTGRLRSKVENYAIYSALFLSMSIALLTDVPSYILKTCEEDIGDVNFWLCHIRLRIYLYGLGIGTAAHMLSILLAMSFVNALNETARDSDVYRMFARGKGFLATVKCQHAFRLGCVADFVAVVCSLTYHIPYEAVVLTLILVVWNYRILRETANLLFSTAGIVTYWREDLGGKPDKDDPYDLQVPVGVFKECARINNDFLKPSLGPAAPSEDSALWNNIHESMKSCPVASVPKQSPAAAGSQSSQIHTAVVAALF